MADHKHNWRAFLRAATSEHLQKLRLARHRAIAGSELVVGHRRCQRGYGRARARRRRAHRRSRRPRAVGRRIGSTTRRDTVCQRSDLPLSIDSGRVSDSRLSGGATRGAPAGALRHSIGPPWRLEAQPLPVGGTLHRSRLTRRGSMRPGPTGPRSLPGSSRPALGEVSPACSVATRLRTYTERRRAPGRARCTWAIMLARTAEQLCAMYRTQFSSLRKHEYFMYFDAATRPLHEARPRSGDEVGL